MKKNFNFKSAFGWFHDFLKAVNPWGYSYSNNTERTKNNEIFLKTSVAVVYGLRGLYSIDYTKNYGLLAPKSINNSHRIF